MGTVRRLRPIRVLLASRDPRFLGVAAFLFRRKGFAVDTTRNLGELPERIERHGSNVVVLDSSNSVRAAARTATMIEASHPRVGVVLVTDEGEADGRPEPRPASRWSSLLSKWAFARIVSEVERLYMRATLPQRLAPIIRFESHQAQRR